MSDISDQSDKESYGEKDEDFNVEDYQDDLESDESFNDIVNDDNKNSEDEEQSAGGSPDKVNDEFIGTVLPGGHKFNKKLVCVRYPGNVINQDKAVETLGGITEISETVNASNRRMELRFRPDDGYCKPACGDRHQTAGFLLRIRIKKSRRKNLENTQVDDKLEKEPNAKVANGHDSSQSGKNEKSTNSPEEEIVKNLTDQITNDSAKQENPQEPTTNHNDNDDKNKSPTFDRNKYENLADDKDYELPKLKVLGRVDTEFRFTNLCDFQYLPITKNKDDPTKDECIYDSIYPVGLPSYSWMKKDVPYFLPPAAFSRMDSVQQYVPKTEISNNGAHYVIGKTRKRRAGLSNFINFNTPIVPKSAPKGIETALKVKFLGSTHVEKMRKVFEERPIWSKTALMYVTKFSNEHLKVLLPSVAYYFMTGPWRITWVRLGYDPRKDPEARIYQTLDYRLKAMHGLHSSITCKRNYSEYTLPYKNTPSSKAKEIVLMPNTSELQGQKKVKEIDENVYIYKPGTIPPSRQMFYQYCDVHVLEIQDMLKKCAGPPPGTPCHEKLGWLPGGFDDMCREIINKQVRMELRKLMNIPENHPTKLPRKRKMGGPTGKVQKRKAYKKKKEKSEKPEERQPPAMSILDEDDMMQSDDDEWEEDLDGPAMSASENENDIDDELEKEIDKEIENAQEIFNEQYTANDNGNDNENDGENDNDNEDDNTN
ncbi:hypothetical protein TSAR_014419 [Trichomalopsis sarcophagae]|uniref:Transcription factor IIIC subunit 5 HTH domain-containing protein n=1 Tax=Trichomalopsis sarcophagae TaxID=543379 RepID=A0A232EPY5_9HYME|nr:hypothetical protein TSAR_014419 [Trichomalopsis sarcophagae]